VTVARRAGLVFLAMVALDVAFTLYVIKSAEKATLEASAWAAAIQICNVFVVTAFVKDARMLLPCMAGAFFGTWLAITWF
jgi:hypothetical protein